MAPSEWQLYRSYLRRHPAWLLIPGVIGFASFAFVAQANLVIGIIFALATSFLALHLLRTELRERIEGEFFAAYAASRGLASEPLGLLPEGTPLPHDTSARLARHVMRGELPGGIEGLLAHHEHTPERTTFHFTVAVAPIGGPTGGVSRLSCRPRAFGGFFEPATDLLRLDQRRIAPLESECLEDRSVFYVDEGQDENDVRQLLSPSFIIWLAEQAPSGFGFELEEGTLTGTISEYVRDPSELDGLSEATATVVRRIREEAAES